MNMRKSYRGRSRPENTGSISEPFHVREWRIISILMLMALFCSVAFTACIFASRSDDECETGIASWYGKQFNGHMTSSGERYNMFKLTAAHKTFPLGSIVRVTNLDNGKSVKVRINDRGPFVEGRIIDLSYAAALKLGIVKTGTARVRLQLLH